VGLRLLSAMRALGGGMAAPSWWPHTRCRGGQTQPDRVMAPSASPVGPLAAPTSLRGEVVSSDIRSSLCPGSRDAMANRPDGSRAYGRLRLPEVVRPCAGRSSVNGSSPARWYTVARHGGSQLALFAGDDDHGESGAPTSLVIYPRSRQIASACALGGWVRSVA
jgi:hypothetical protein